MEASASKTEVRVGEVFRVEVRASGPAGARYGFPADPGNESVELHEAPPAASPAPAQGSHAYTAAAFAVGEAEVPPIAVHYRLPDGSEGEVTTQAIPLRIVSVLPKDPKQQKLVDVRGPVALRVGGAFWLAAGLLLVLAAGLLVAWLRRRRRSAAPAPAAPALSPDVEALRALDRLAAAGLLEAGDFRGFYIALTEIAKGYLEARLGAPVLEMTSAETHAFLRGHAQAASFAAPLRDLWGAADRIKFARGDGLEAEARRHLDGVRRLVAGLEEALRPRPEERVA